MSLKLYLTLSLTTGYAILRYAILGPVSAENIPVYLVNKGVSFAAAAYLLYAAWNVYKQQIDRVVYWGKSSIYLTIIHILLSLAIFSPEYFAKLYTGEKMNIWGEMTILGGTLCAFAYWYIPKVLSKPRMLHLLHLYAAFSLAIHMFFLGAPGWLNITGWYGGLPPISLLSFLLSMGSFILFSLSKKHTISA